MNLEFSSISIFFLQNVFIYLPIDIETHKVMKATNSIEVVCISYLAEEAVPNGISFTPIYFIIDIHGKLFKHMVT